MTMAASGYFHDEKPLLYDRGTESLWVENAGKLKVVAGNRNGEQNCPGSLSPVRSPGSRGSPRTRAAVCSWRADRSRGVPHE